MDFSDILATEEWKAVKRQLELIIEGKIDEKLKTPPDDSLKLAELTGELNMAKRVLNLHLYLLPDGAMKTELSEKNETWLRKAIVRVWQSIK